MAVIAGVRGARGGGGGSTPDPLALLNYISIGANPAQTGLIRLANAGRIYWRNAGNSADILFAVIDAGNSVTLGDVGQSATIQGNAVQVNGGGRITLFANSSGINLGAASGGNFGSGLGVIGISNAATNPTTNPGTGSGCVQYATGGANTTRGGNGTVTTMGPA